jgi:hypothetical protein
VPDFPVADQAGRFYSFIEFLLQLVRAQDAADPRDKIFSILGIIDRLLPPDMEEFSLKPDYSLSTGAAYTAMASLLLQNLPFLSALSYVEDKSIRRLEQLPSWVPDYSSERQVQPLILGSQFNASLAERDSSMSPSIISNRLYLHGACFDSVTSVALAGGNDSAYQDWQEPTCLAWLQSIFSLLLQLEPLYVTTESRLEVLWRTLVADMTVQEHYQRHKPPPSPEKTADSFKFFLIWLLGGDVLEVGPEDEDTFRELVFTVATLAVAEKSESWRGFSSQLRQYDEIVLASGGSAVAADDEPEHQDVKDVVAGKSQLFTQMFARVCSHRRLFKTSLGFLGFGPASLRLGDQVWMLRGAKVPFALRDRPGTSEFELMGETYLHGFMYGRMFDERWGLERRILPVAIT